MVSTESGTRAGWAVIKCSDSLFCRVSSLLWPMAGLSGGALSGGMAAMPPFARSRELGLAAVAHLSHYRGTSRDHTESDLRVFFGWCQDRQLPPLDAQRHDLELPAVVAGRTAVQAVHRLPQALGRPAPPRQP